MDERDFSYRFEINYGSGPGDEWVFSVDNITKEDMFSMDDIEFMRPGVAISEGLCKNFLMPFFEKHFDPSYFYNEYFDIDEIEKGYFDDSKENFYSYDMINEICDEILEMADKLENDYWSPGYEKIKHNIKILYEIDCKNYKSDQNDPDVFRAYLHHVISFLLRFVKAIKGIMSDNPECNIVSVSGP